MGALVDAMFVDRCRCCSHVPYTEMLPFVGKSCCIGYPPSELFSFCLQCSYSSVPPNVFYCLAGVSTLTSPLAVEYRNVVSHGRKENKKTTKHSLDSTRYASIVKDSFFVAAENESRTVFQHAVTRSLPWCPRSVGLRQ